MKTEQRASVRDQVEKPLVVILGPTGVGKTEISIELAERLGGEIVSADSRLVYRGMDIGTAKPNHSDRNRVMHHLIDIVDPDHFWSLADYQQAAKAAIDEIHQRDKLPMLVGGTGQYITAVCEGWTIPKQEPDQRLRSILEKWGREIGAEELHSRLSKLDPAAVNKIEPRNLRRTVRALEVIFHTGEKFSTQRTKKQSPYRLLRLGLIRPRDELYKRIDVRIQQMIDVGLIEEVRRLLKSGYSPSLPSMSAIGYNQIARYLQRSTTLEEAVADMKRLTRQFVRRQANWFKLDDPGITWFPVVDGIVERIESVIREFISND